MRVAGVFAHADDEVLAAGGTLAKHAQAGDRVAVYVLADGVTSRGAGDIDGRLAMFDAACGALGVEHSAAAGWPDQRLDTVPLLEIARWITVALERFQPEIVYTHHRGDLNRDHQICAEAVLIATRPQPGMSVKRVYAGEVLSSTEWAFDGSFVPNLFVDISGEPLGLKTAALACYESELRSSPHPRSEGIVHTLARLRGSMIGVNHAEAFHVLREIA